MKVTIGVPTFNRADLLRRALASLADQGTEVAVVVSDNGSTDHTRDVCEEAAGTIDRFTYVFQNPPVPAADNFAQVLRHADTELFGWLADDDWLEPGSLCLMEQALDADPASVLAVPTVRYFDDVGHLAVVEQAEGLNDEHPPVRAAKYLSGVANNGTFYGLRRREVTAATPFPSVLAGDWLHVIGLALRGAFVAVPDAVLNRRMGGESADLAALAASFGAGRHTQRHAQLHLPRLIATQLLRGFPPLDEARLTRRLIWTARIAGPRWAHVHYLHHKIQLKRAVQR